nr:hypothetical protein [Tanacetum cinerariifolium]
MPSFVTHDSPDLLKSSSRDTTEPITTIGVAPQSTSTNGCTESDTRRRKRGAPGSLSESHIRIKLSLHTLHRSSGERVGLPDQALGE